jgi:predicted transcriptional regulator of viral defense system
MKNFWSLFEIRDVALKTGRAVFSTKELANLISKKNVVANVYSNRLVKKGLAKKLISGKISFVDDEFVIASQLLEPSYITGLSALNLLGLIKQVPAKIECVSPKRSIKYEALGVVYHKIPASLFFAYKMQKRGSSYIWVAETEKAIIDGIYLNILSKELVNDLSDFLDHEKLKNYANRFHGKGRKKLLESLGC